MRVYGIKNCDSVKKALKFLDERGIKYEFVDLKNGDLDCNVVEAWLKEVDIDKLFNKKSKAFKELHLDKELSEEEKKELLCKKSLILKRPIIEFDDGYILVGFDVVEFEEIFD